MSIGDMYRKAVALKLGRDLVPGDVMLEDGLARRVLHATPSFRTGQVQLTLRTEWGAEFSDVVGINQQVKVLP